MTKHLCKLAQADLAWLGSQPVLGAGSVVLHGAAIRMPMVILRPRVSHDYNSAAKSLDRELCYNTVDFKFLRSRAITDTLAKARWPMSKVPVNFAWDGPESPFYLPAADMRLQAERWGIEVGATTSHQKLQPLVVAKAATVYQQQFKAAMDAAWQAALDAPRTEEPTLAVEPPPAIEPTLAVEPPPANEPTKEVEPPMEDEPTKEVEPPMEVEPPSTIEPPGKTGRPRKLSRPAASAAALVA